MAKHLVAKVGELPEGGGKLVEVEYIEIGLFLIEGEYRAYRNMCPHAGAPVCNAALNKVLTSDQITIAERERPTIRCPWHGWEFDLGTGCHTFTNARLRNYEVEVEGDDISIVIPVPVPVAPMAPLTPAVPAEPTTSAASDTAPVEAATAETAPAGTVKPSDESTS